MNQPIVSNDIRDELQSGPEYSEKLKILMQNARDASDLLKALSHENRLLLLCLLSEQERSVGELENILSLRQAAVSQQLARLRFDGVVTTRREGKTIYYSIASDEVRQIVKVLYDIYCDADREDKK